MKASHNLYGKKLLSLPILLLLILSLFSALNVNITTVSAIADFPAIYVVPESNTKAVGETFNVSIYTNYTYDPGPPIYWGFDIHIYQFTLNYDPNVLHGGIQKQDWDTWTGDGVTKTFNATLTPVVPHSEEVYVNETLMTRITRRTDTWIGDGVTASFFTTQKPVVARAKVHPESEEVYVNQTFKTRDEDYTVNWDTGNITFYPAPEYGVPIEATYDYGHYDIEYKTGKIKFIEYKEYEEIKFTTVPGSGAEVKAIYMYNGVVNGDIIVNDPPLRDSAKFIPGDFDNTAGTLSLTMGLFVDEGEYNAGPGTLANVTFTVVGKGASNITLGSETKLYGWDAFDPEPHAYVIIDAATMPTHIQHGYFDNRFQHDVAVGSVTAPDKAAVGELVPINVTVANIGKSEEEANVTIRYDTTFIDSQNVTLALGENATASFGWNTTGVAQGTYTINATATVSGDGDLDDNWNITTILILEHNLAVGSVTAPDKAAVGELVPINVTVANIGASDEVANVTIRYDTTLIGFNDTVELPAQNSTIVPFSWNTSGVAKDTYTVNATATIRPRNETDTWTGNGVNTTFTATGKPIVPDSEEVYVNETLMTKLANYTIDYETGDITFTTAPGVGAEINATYLYPVDLFRTDNWNATTILLVMHDVAVISLDAPANATIGDIVPINVTVRNIGASDENVTFKVSYLKKIEQQDDYRVVDTATENVTDLLANTTRPLLFEWNTTGLEKEEGEELYKINATATIIGFDDDDLSDNTIITIKPIQLVPGHDVKVISITRFPSVVFVGEPVNITVNVENVGGVYENFTVKVTYDGNLAAESQISLTSGSSTSLSHILNTTGVAPGYYTIWAEAILPENLKDINPIDNKRSIGINVKLPLGNITGTVTDASTGYPIEGANVAANGYSDITDANGHYNITDVLAGTYTVTASATGYESSSQTDITVVAGETTTVNFTLTPLPTTGTIAGIVKDSSTGDPIAGATVTANGMSATTNSSGAYTISDALAGTYTVTASANGYEDSSQTDITVVAGETTTVDFELTPAQPPNILLYAGVAAVAIIAIAAIAVYVLKVRKPA